MGNVSIGCFVSVFSCETERGRLAVVDASVFDRSD